MTVHHITSNPKVRVLYQRLDILDTVDAALVRNNGGQAIGIVAEELGQDSLPFNEFIEHLDSLQILGVADFRVDAVHPRNPWQNTVLISNINTRVLSNLRRKTRHQLDKERGRSNPNSASLASKLLVTMQSINRTVIAFSLLLATMTSILGWKYWPEILRLIQKVFN